MLEFQEFRLEDIEPLREWIASSGKMGCELSPVCRFLWQEKYPTKWCRYRSFLLMRYGTSYGFPIGDGDRQKLFEILLQIKEDAEKEGVRLRFWGLSKEEAAMLEEFFPGEFEITTSRDEWDYIYRSEDLIQLAGKKYQAKRNHISRFRRNFVYEYCDISRENRELCFAAAEQWVAENQENAEGLQEELKAISLALEHFEELRMRGGMLLVDGKVVAFTMGSEISPRVFDVHFEKAMAEYDGAYTVIHQEFAARNLASYEYINREEDMGIPGLRKAKLSYQPVFLVEKYAAVLR